MASLTTRYVQAGACYSNWMETSVALSCALDSKQCDAMYGAGHTTFKRSSEKCLTDYGLGFETTIGRCQSSSDRYVCTGNEAACVLPGLFEKSDDLCTVLADRWSDRQLERSVFGACAQQSEPYTSHCFWSRDDCPTDSGDYRWYGANPIFNTNGCFCEDTLVGACTFDNGDDWYCAVSADACTGTTPATYLNVQALRDTHQAECRLCRPPQKLPQPYISTTSATANPTTGNNSKRMGPIILGSVLAVVLAILTVLVVLMAGRRRRQQQASELGRGDDIDTAAAADESVGASSNDLGRGYENEADLSLPNIS